MRILFVSFWLALSLLRASSLHFDTYELKGDIDGDTLLVIGGIHGDEPGGYFASSMLFEHYSIKKGKLIIIPNLNFDSIIQNARGIYGDMNRKFATISKDDADYETITKIKQIILRPDVNLILNLHDGHGFYRETWENIIFNPKAWGQSFIIDQQSIESPKYSNLGEITQEVTKRLNTNLFENHHTFSVKNTKTKFKDEQMQLSLTYFAITHNKPALAIETSKNLKELPQKVIYQLSAIEEFMRVVGIEWERDFDLTYKNVEDILKNLGYVTINSNIQIPLNNVRNILNYVPLQSQKNSFVFSHPLGAYIENKNSYEIYVGNNKTTLLKKDTFELSNKKPNITIATNGKNIDATSLFEVEVGSALSIKTEKSIRVNVIGYVGKEKNEADVLIKQEEMVERFSLDNDGKIYRAEFYDDEKFVKTINIIFKE
jgi:hypothetical protein